MNFFVLGLNHETAPLAIRERFAFACEGMSSLLNRFQAMAESSEMVFISTCNRSEWYCIEGTPQILIKNLREYVELDASISDAIWYVHHNESALRHLIKVASGLDSMILGEPQILGQVKSAYEIAKQAGVIGKKLHQIFQQSFFISKKIRSETAIGKNPISVSFAAVRLAQRLFSKLEKTNILMIGAGETIELVSKHFFNQGATQFVFANRTLARAETLANLYQADAILLDELPMALGQVDIIVSAVQSPCALLDLALLKRTRAQTKAKTLLIIDLGVPRNVATDVTEWPDIYLYSVDDLQSIVVDNLSQRQAAAEMALDIIEREIQLFSQKQLLTGHAEVVQSFMEEMDEALLGFFEEAVIQRLPSKEQEAIKKVMKRFQHQALQVLQKNLSR